MRDLGLKTEARKLMQASGVPVVPGTLEPLADIAGLEKAAQEDPVSFGDLRCAEPLGKLRNDPRFQALLRRVGLPP